MLGATQLAAGANAERRLGLVALQPAGNTALLFCGDDSHVCGLGAHYGYAT